MRFPEHILLQHKHHKIPKQYGSLKFTNNLKSADNLLSNWFFLIHHFANASSISNTQSRKIHARHFRLSNPGLAPLSLQQSNSSSKTASKPVKKIYSRITTEQEKREKIRIFKARWFNRMTQQCVAPRSTQLAVSFINRTARSQKKIIWNFAAKETVQGAFLHGFVSNLETPNTLARKSEKTVAASKNAVTIFFLRKEKTYTKLKYSRVPQYDTSSNASAALLAGLLGFIISEKFGFEMVDSGDLYTAGMYFLIFCFTIRLYYKTSNLNSSNVSIYNPRGVVQFYTLLLRRVCVLLKKGVTFFKFK